MVIDKNKKHILTNYQSIRKGWKANDSDHNTEYMDLDLKIESRKPERIEIFNFKDKEGQVKFKEITSLTSEFSSCLKTDASLVEQIEKWQELLKSFCNQAFKKIRIKDRSMKPINKEISNLIDKRNDLLGKDRENKNIKDDLESINNEIANREAEDNRNKLVENFQYFSENPDKINMSQMWKLLKKLWPKTGISLPTSKKNHKGKSVSGAEELKILMAKEYKQRLRTRL